MLELPNKISLPFIICERRCFRSLFEFICLWKCFFASIIICLKWFFFFFLGSLFKERGLRSNRIIHLCGSVSLFFSVFFFFFCLFVRSFTSTLLYSQLILCVTVWVLSGSNLNEEQFFVFVFLCVCVFFFFFFEWRTIWIQLIKWKLVKRS